MVIERANDSLYKNAQGTKKIIPFSIFQELQYESNLYLKKRGGGGMSWKLQRAIEKSSLFPD